MALTRSFKELVQRHVAEDPAYGEAFAARGDRHHGRRRRRQRHDDPARQYVKATIGFEKLGEATGTQPKSLIRMFGPRRNLQAHNLFSVLGDLQKRAGVELHVIAGPV